MLAPCRPYADPSDVSANAFLSTSIYALFVFGFVFLLSSTFALDHFELCGLSQASLCSLVSCIELCGLSQASLVQLV